MKIPIILQLHYRGYNIKKDKKGNYHGYKLNKNVHVQSYRLNYLFNLIDEIEEGRLIK